MGPPSIISHRVPAGLAIVLVLCLGLLGGCREEEGAVKVAQLSFEGNEAFDDGVLKDVIVTEAKGILPWARSRYFNRQEFQADLQRLRAFYTDRGYPSVTVDAVDVSFNENRDEVRIRIGINEGSPLIVERVEVLGLETVQTEIAEAARQLPLKAGEPFDRQLLAQSRERAVFALHDRGYPDARVEVTEAPGSSPDHRVVTFTATPGPLATFGTVSTVGLEDVGPSVVRRTLAFRVGDTYRESQVLESQRRLSALGVFNFAHVDRTRVAEEAAAGDAPVTRTIAMTGPESPGAVPMSVTVAEAKPTRLRLGLGYGTEDGPRGSLNWQHVNFLGAARRFSADAKYSLRLREIGLDLVQPYILSRAISVRAHVGATWTNELEYSARRIGGRGSLEYRGRISRGLDAEPLEHIIRGTYLNETLQYGIKPETLDDLTNFDEFIALGFDPVTGNGRGRVASLGLDLERRAVDRQIDPRQGYTVALRLERAAPWLGGTYDYSELMTDARAYVPVGGAVVAGRVRWGALYAGDSLSVPFSARYFLGGSSSLRGWGRFQVAPLTVDGLPIGGRGLLESSAEVRLPISGSFGAVAFVDAGNVWAERSAVSFSDLRVNVGPGLRWTSPVGVVRADFGYQLTPIDGLVIEGQLERRQWRVHFSIGEAF